MKKLLYKCMLSPAKWLWRFTNKLHRISGKWLIHVMSTYNSILCNEHLNE